MKPKSSLTHPITPTTTQGSGRDEHGSTPPSEEVVTAARRTPMSDNQASTPAPGVASAPIAIALSAIHPSPSNPRRRIDEKALAELTDSVRRHGVLLPILVRPNGNKTTAYELVAGYRRYEAAKSAGLPQIPAVIRTLTDLEVLEIQVVENLQRKDLHPLEEADGYRRLHEEYGCTVDEIAGKIGKSRAYVYARLKLCELPEAAKEACWTDALNPSIALLLARIPEPKLAGQAAAEILKGQREWDGKRDVTVPLSYREAARIIHTRYMTALSAAPWKRDDPDLLPAAGPCTTCSKRTGNQLELFDDVKSADVCTDVSCFAAKRSAWEHLREAEVLAGGGTVLSDKESKALFPYRGSYIQGGTHVDLDAHCPMDPKGRTWRRHLESKAPLPLTLARDGDGTLHEVLPKATAMKVLKEKGYKWADSASAHTQGNDEYRKRLEQEKRERKIHTLLGQRAIALVLEKTKAIAEPDLLQAVIGYLVTQTYLPETSLTRICERHGLTPPPTGSFRSDRIEWIQKWCGKAKTPALRLLIYEWILHNESAFYSGGLSTLAKQACETAGVNLKALEKDIRTGLGPKKTNPATTRKSRRKGRPQRLQQA